MLARAQPPQFVAEQLPHRAATLACATTREFGRTPTRRSVSDDVGSRDELASVPRIPRRQRGLAQDVAAHHRGRASGLRLLALEVRVQNHRVPTDASASMV
jgi:hypothetical protein